MWIFGSLMPQSVQEMLDKKWTGRKNRYQDVSRQGLYKPNTMNLTLHKFFLGIHCICIKRVFQIAEKILKGSGFSVNFMFDNL